MSYYDPLLAELEQLDQPNYLTQSGQAMSMRGAPIRPGGGFWGNLAQQIVPGLLGAGMSYLGQQQNRGEQDALLAAAKLEDPQAIAASLEAGGYKDTAAKVLFAAQAQKQAEAQKIADLKNQFEHSTKAAYLLAQPERDRDEAYRQAQLGLSRGSQSLQREQLQAARDEKIATLEAMKTKAIQDLELRGSGEVIKDPTVQDYKKAIPYGYALKQIIENGGDSGIAGIAIDKAFSRIVSPEAVNEGDIKMLSQGAGFTGQAKDIGKWLTGDAGKNPVALRIIGDISNRVLEGKRQAALEAQIGVQDRYKYYGANPERVSTDLPSIAIKSPTEILAQKKAELATLQAKAAGKDPSSNEALAAFIRGLQP